MRYRPRVIAYLVPATVDLMDLVAITSVLSYPTVEGQAAYSSAILSLQSQTEVYSRDGLILGGCIPYSEYSGRIDILVIVGCEAETAKTSIDLIQWIRRRSTEVRRIVCVGDGAFILAQAGILDGKRVTTHWRHATRLKELHPHLRLETDPIFIQDGKVCTTAGMTTGIDVALGIVEEDFGRTTVNAIARRMALYLRRAGNEKQQSKFLTLQREAEGTSLRDLPAWVKSHLTHRLDVSTLARVTALTPRTLARHFNTYFHTTPARWIQSIRVEAACSLLYTPDVPIKAIAALTGFRDEHAMRRAFLQEIAVTPKAYRDSLISPPMTEEHSYTWGSPMVAQESSGISAPF